MPHTGLLLVPAALLGLASCGGGDDDATSAASTFTEAPDTSEAPTTPTESSTGPTELPSAPSTEEAGEGAQIDGNCNNVESNITAYLPAGSFDPLMGGFVVTYTIDGEDIGTASSEPE